jgi:hypothetical protein
VCFYDTFLGGLRHFFLLSLHLFVSLLDVLLLLGLRESWCWMSILGTVMPDSSEPATAMALLTRWPTTNDHEEEDKLSYAPLPHLSSSSSSSPSSLPWLSFSCPASSASLVTTAAAALSFPRGLLLNNLFKVDVITR